MHRKAWVLGVLLAVTACASRGGWEPTIDTYGTDVDVERLEYDKAQCRQLAEEASGGTAKQATKGAAVGGLIGAAAGAAIGAATGSPGTGAAVGAAAGGIGGGTKEGLESEDAFKRAYSNCLRERGYRVIN